MEIIPALLPWNSVYKLLIGAVLPRPIGWISTVNPVGQPNLAPFSFFNIVCANPPLLMFSPMIRSTDGQPKDTLQNVRQTGEFVVNIVTEALAAAMNLSSTELPPNINEFEVIGLTPIASSLVQPPRLGESPINFECQVRHILDLGDQPGASSLVIGQVMVIHVRDDLLVSGDQIDFSRLQPVGRLAGGAFCRVTDIFELPRPPSQIK